MASPSQPIVYGASYSTYVRTVRLTLVEKGVPYQWVEIDVFAPDGPPSDYLKINPFGRIPAFDHDGFRMYEAVPIARYIDEAFAGLALQPKDVHERARMNQILSVLDSYAYRTLVWDIYVERTSGASTGKAPDEERIARALPRAQLCLEALSGLMGDGLWLAGSALTLADLHAAPMFAYFLSTQEGQDLIGSVPRLTRWWHHVAQRASMRATEAVSHTTGHR
jgi:glutathione S-transferase